MQSFEKGKEYVFQWDENETRKTLGALGVLDSYLSQFDPSLSYEGTDKRICYRKSCWFATNSIGEPLLDTEDKIAKFDGDLKDGLSGLQALQDPKVKDAMRYLKNALDESLIITALAVNIPLEMLKRCTVRYRIIKYIAHAGRPGGIGLHPDGNLLSSLITNGPGLGVYDFDGTFRKPDFKGTILMGGSTLYRWSKGVYIPTFHDVEITAVENKSSIVAFLNFPDMVQIPRTLGNLEVREEDFFHDIRRIKEDDKSPAGELASLWNIIIEKHQLVLPDN